MSARLNFNEIPFFSWKGKTFSQITANLHKNDQLTDLKNNNMFRALPLKIYRKEIAAPIKSGDHFVCQSRASQSVQNYEFPGGTVTTDTTKYENANGLVNTLDINYVSSKTDHPCSSCDDNIRTSATDTSLYSKSLSQQDNARRRVRSAGMIRRKFDALKNNDTYYTSAKQYLYSRNQTFSQNEYHNIRQGSATAKPGSSYTTDNKYSSNTASHCSNNLLTDYVPVYYKPNNSKFAGQGAVTSSNRLVRLKYDTITKAGLQYRAAYGTSVENALAYGVSENGYTIKDKIGFPVKKTPVFSKYSDKMNSCSQTGFVS